MASGRTIKNDRQKFGNARDKVKHCKLIRTNLLTHRFKHQIKKALKRFSIARYADERHPFGVQSFSRCHFVSVVVWPHWIFTHRIMQKEYNQRYIFDGQTARKKKCRNGKDNSSGKFDLLRLKQISLPPEVDNCNCFLFSFSLQIFVSTLATRKLFLVSVRSITKSFPWTFKNRQNANSYFRCSYFSTSHRWVKATRDTSFDCLDV